MDKFFDVVKVEGMNAQMSAALEQISTSQGVIDVFKAANSFDLLEFIITSRVRIAKAIQQNARDFKYNEILNSESAKAVAEMTGQTVEQIAKLGAEKYLESINMPSFLKEEPVVVAASTSSKRTVNPRNPIVEVEINGVKHYHSGGGQIREEIAHYFHDQVKNIKDIGQRKAKLKELIYAHKTEGAEEFKLNTMVDAVLEVCTIRFALKDERGQIRNGGLKNLPLATNCRGRTYEGFLQELAVELKKGKKVADFYIKNDIDDEARKAEFIARIEESVKEFMV